MSTSKHSFMDIFETEFPVGQDSVRLQKIIIPIIQRDYAQGRDDVDVRRIRGRFLEALYRAVTEIPITLDFVYGDIDLNGVMTPLDGQQRLTTLFLLHWYAAKKGNILEEEYVFLKSFSYETRYSARYFCGDLVSFTPSFTMPLSEEIIDQAWFPLDWQKDPTISSMLVMLNDIDRKFKDVQNLWEKLKAGAITFYFLPIRDMGLTDELYIKMNSRGKPLTRFEHFKAELERSIRLLNESTANRIISKIDIAWTDLLWRYRDSGQGTSDDAITDDEFLKYFQFICDIFCYQNDKSPQGKSRDEFDLLQEYFTGNKELVLEHISMLESYFDCWCNIDGYLSPTDFLQSVMTHAHAENKILVEPSDKIDIFEDCLHFYADKNGRTRLFPLNRIVLLYAVICYLRNTDLVTEDQFRRRIRIINNLIRNSSDEISDRTDRNRIPAILRQVDAIVLTGQIDESIENSFNVNQLTEEKEKSKYLSEHPEQAIVMYKLEDHPNLYGQISIIGLDHLDYTDRFYSLFTCGLDEIDCALMSVGNYGQMGRMKWRHQFASSRMKSAWDGLFHRSANYGFDNTSKILNTLLSKSEKFSNEALRGITNTFIYECEEQHIYPWRYYYVKYPAFRPGSFGKLSNDDPATMPYMYSVMQTKTQWSSNTYMPFLKEADPAHLSRELYGQRLVYPDVHIVCQNASYLVRDNETEEILEEITILQNEEGIDTEDRIIKLKQYIQKYPELR